MANACSRNSCKTSLPAHPSSAGSLLCCLVCFPGQTKHLGVGVCGKRRSAIMIISIISETATFYMPVTSEAFRVEVASLVY